MQLEQVETPAAETAAGADEALMMAYGEGDMGAFATLYQRHKDATYRYFLRQGLPVEFAAELQQELWLKIVQARSRYQPTAKFTTYLYTLAHNVFIDHLRRHKEFSSFEDENVEPIINEVSAELSENIMERVNFREITQYLLQLVIDLPMEQRQAFLLKEEAGCTLQEIADITGVTHEGVKSRLRYAISKLRRGMQDYVTR